MMTLGYGIFALAFISVFREGIETILFLYAVTMQKGGLSVPLSFVGAGLGIGVGYMIFIQGKKVPLKTFFNVSSFVLIFVAAGMLTYGVHELESAKVIPYYGGQVNVEEDQVIATRVSGDSKIFIFNKSSDKRRRSAVLKNGHQGSGISILLSTLMGPIQCSMIKVL